MLVRSSLCRLHIKADVDTIIDNKFRKFNVDSAFIRILCFCFILSVPTFSYSPISLSYSVCLMYFLRLTCRGSEDPFTSGVHQIIDLFQGDTEKNKYKKTSLSIVTDRLGFFMFFKCFMFYLLFSPR